MNYLGQLKGANQQVPLTYVTRKLQTPTFQPRDEDERKLYAVNHRGPKWNLDNKKVYSILKGFLVDTMAWAWMKEHDRNENGREAWKSMCDHYNGPGEKEKRLSQALEHIKVSHYKNEHTFLF